MVMGAPALAAISTAMSVGSAAMGMISSINQAKYQQQIARNNEITAEENRKRSIEESQTAAVDADEAASQELGFLLSEAGGSGLLAGSGSKGSVIDSKSALAGRDRARIRHAGDVEGANFGRDAAAARAEGDNASRAKSAAIVGGIFNIGSSAISGATKIGRARTSLALNRNANIWT